MIEAIGMGDLSREAAAPASQTGWSADRRGGGPPIPRRLLLGVMAMAEAYALVAGPHEFARHRWPAARPGSMGRAAQRLLDDLVAAALVEQVPGTSAYRLTRAAEHYVDVTRAQPGHAPPAPPPRRRRVRTPSLPPHRIPQVQEYASSRGWFSAADLGEALECTRVYAGMLLRVMTSRGLMTDNGRRATGKRWRLPPPGGAQ